MKKVKLGRRDLLCFRDAIFEFYSLVKFNSDVVELKLKEYVPTLGGPMFYEHFDVRDVLLYENMTFKVGNRCRTDKSLTFYQYQEAPRPICASEVMRAGIEMENDAIDALRGSVSAYELELEKVRVASSRLDFGLSPLIDIVPGLKSWEDFKNHPKVRLGKLDGVWRVETKSKTRYTSFTYEGRIITLAGKNTGNKIEVGYSVYCDNVLDKRKSKQPNDSELSKKIALGRLGKNPIYSMAIFDEPHRFIDTVLDIVRTKILKSELIIKGIR